MTDKRIKIAEAKGRPMLYWVGKKPLDVVKSFPAQLVEVFRPPKTGYKKGPPTFESLKSNWQNLLFHGENSEVLGFLLANGFRGAIDLIYFDPPFDSNANYIRRVDLRGFNEKTNLEGEGYTVGEQLQYTDIWANDTYLQFMYERLLLMSGLLSSEGVLVLHCDWHKNHYLRLLLDEVFGPENFVNEVIWYHWTKFQMRDMGSLVRNHDTLLVYAKNRKGHIMNQMTRPLDRPKKLKRIYWDKEKGRIQNVKDDSGKVVYDEVTDEKVDDVWDIPHVGTKAKERTDYPTQKPIELVEYVVDIFSNSNSIVLDPFLGSGTTAMAAQKKGRKWIGIDINKGAIQSSSKKIQELIKKQLKGVEGNGKLDKTKARPSYSFATYKINDYDLRLLEAEATEMAIEHLGIEKSKTDRFFDGTLGKNLVKIIEFNHPLTPLDLQLIEDELRKRPDENRNVTIVCLGKDLAVDALIEDHNIKHPVNKLEVVELRTDSKYGRFMAFRPPQANLDIKREGDLVRITIKNFISPSIIDRLNDPERLVKVKITDFRSMIDEVLVDTNYDGKVFNVVYSDIPESKEDFVKGAYELDIQKSKVVVAVKVIDMLGQEAIITRKI